MCMAALTITSISTKNGTTINLPSSGVLCVVGGNNVGKSQFLRDIPMRVRGKSDNLPTVLVDDVDYTVLVETNNAIEWLKSNSVEDKDSRGVITYRAPGSGNGASASNFQMWISNSPPVMEPIIDWFVRAPDATQRSSNATSQTGAGSIRDQSSSLHMLFRDGELEALLSDLCEKAFGFPLTLDRTNGNVMLRVGKPNLPSPVLQNPTVKYSDEVLNLPALSDQGDGVKNYLGMVLHLMSGSESVTVFDEPEAFLHPAQARALGRHLGQEVYKRNRQLITATHDRDFVLGLLGSNCPLTILRIDRVGNSNTFTSINSSIIADIWSKPALRYSNLLQGLFIGLWSYARETQTVNGTQLWLTR